MNKVNEKAAKLAKESDEEPKKPESATTKMKKEFEKEAKDPKESLFQYESPLGVKYMDYEGLKITI